MSGAHPANYLDANLNRRVVKIAPGEYFATTQPVIIATVLGSCVACCLHDPIRGWAGMNHFMLPDPAPGAVVEPQSSLRYGIFAMERLINEFIKRGSMRSDLEAKVFGGAAVIDAITDAIGDRNARFVTEYLAVERIHVTASDLGGILPRRVLMFVEDGRVLVKYLERQRSIIGRRDLAFASDLSRSAETAGAVELF
jgi:chemotaxis protein CheD